MQHIYSPQGEYIMTEGDGFCDFAQNDGSGWLPGPDNRLPVAKELGETSLMLLVHPTLTAQNIEDTISVVKAVVARATR